MTSTTAETTRTITEKHEVHLCDHCGMDESAESGEILTYIQAELDEEGNLLKKEVDAWGDPKPEDFFHYHEECKDKARAIERSTTNLDYDKVVLHHDDIGKPSAHEEYKFRFDVRAVKPLLVLERSGIILLSITGMVALALYTMILRNGGFASLLVNGPNQVALLLLFMTLAFAAVWLSIAKKQAQNVVEYGYVPVDEKLAQRKKRLNKKLNK